MPKKITSDTTSITIDTITFPKNVLSLSQEGPKFTIRAWGAMLVTDKVLFSDFTDASNVPYTSDTAFVTAFKTAAYA